MRNITIYNSESNNTRVIESGATLWNQLQSELADNGIDVTNKKAIVRETKVSLEADDAQLPTEAFTLFLFPVKVKSGNESQEEKLERIKSNVIEEVEEFSDRLTDYISQKCDELKEEIETKFQVINGITSELQAESERLAREISGKA